MQAQKYSIKFWAKDDNPREKLLSKSPGVLSDSELLAILIGHGTKSRSAVDLARDVLSLGKNNLNELGKVTISELKSIKGIGKAKAITLAAALELGRRRQAAAPLDEPIIRASRDIGQFLQARFRDLGHEVFAVAFLNRANMVKQLEVVSQGGLTGTVVDLRIIIKRALELAATSIILCHNHPSGNLKPSKADEQITQKVQKAAEFFDISLIDHIIVSHLGFYSFADNGLL